jgi:hypothetical protein
MFKTIKHGFMRLMLQKQLKNLPKDAQDALMAAIEKNPKFFEMISKEVDAKVKQGQDKMFATQAVVMQHRAELQKLLQK